MPSSRWHVPYGAPRIERKSQETRAGIRLPNEGDKMAKTAACLNGGQAAANSTKASVLESKSKSDGWFRLVRDSVRSSQPRYAEGRRVINQAAILGTHE